MTSPYEHLLSPVRVNRLELRNRIVSTGHGLGYADANGLVTDRFIGYYEARAKGGLGLCIIGATMVHRSSPLVRGLLHNWDDSVIPGYRRLSAAVHRHGGRIFTQLTHLGRLTVVERGTAWAPSAVPDTLYRVTARELHEEMIWELVAAYGAAAGRARAGGLDGVELHGGHGYLINQFLSPLTNRRTDAWGGDPERRQRFALEVLRAVRAAVGPDYPVGMRVSGDEFMPGGLDAAAVQDIARTLARTGQLDYLNVSGGIDADHQSRANHIPPMGTPQGNLSYLAAGLREVTGIPTMATSRIIDPLLADRLIGDGQADLVGMTRATISDPELPNKLAAGRPDDVRTCIGCNQLCTGWRERGRAISCLQNPATGNELVFAELSPAPAGRHVVVVGGGPGGLETARIAAERGHRVTLIERSDRLGGSVALAATAPHRADFAIQIRFLERQVRKLGVELRLGQTADLALIESLQPDAVVVATGAHSTVPEIRQAPPGAVLSAAEALGGPPIAAGRIVLLDDDGFQAGVSVAEALAVRGHEVEIVTRDFFVGSELDSKTLVFLYPRLLELGVRLSPQSAVLGFDGDDLLVTGIFGGQPRRVPAPVALVVAGHRRANDTLLEQLRGRVPELHGVGDCLAPRRADSAYWDANRVGRAL